mmetsp:Transcript_2833/g.4672  ORF Transcript_2833/g.4672 Transcript_2833/m.4672 type:complete len:226 (+) Transcript_2833:62-739(+)
MPKDYYRTLGVTRTATPEEIRSGYQWMAMKWHPQRNPTMKLEAELRFHEIAEAYDVLIDPLRRNYYNEYGEQGLKFPAVNSSNNSKPYQYVGDPFALFNSFFKSANPLKSAYDVDLDGSAPALCPKEPEDVLEVELACALEEFQEGATRRLLVDRVRLSPSGEPYTESKAITVPIRPGWTAGLRVTFRGEGNQRTFEKAPGDLVVLLTEQQLASMPEKPSAAVAN